MRLNLGCGGQIVDGWVNVDRHIPPCDPKVDTMVLDLAIDAWPWLQGSADGVVMHHVLDLFTVDDAHGVLRRCYEVMKPGAVLRISFAHLFAGVERAMAGDIDWFVEPIKRLYGDPNPQMRVDLEATVGHFILQGGARKQLLSPLLVQVMCTAAGFPHAMASLPHETLGPDWLRDLDSRIAESAFVEAIR